MDNINKIAVFLVGLGSPASLYSDYINNLKKHLPKTTIFVLEWWSQDDFGINELQSYINNSEVILIGHSAGSVIALQAFAKWSTLVKKIIMLDSHFLRTRNVLPTISRMLDIMLSKDDSSIKNKVKSAYAPIIKNSLAFNKAFQFAIEWVSTSFNQVCTMFNAMPAHSALYIGLTNSSYQILSTEDEKAVLALWEQYSVDVKFLRMNHFDLIDDKYAVDINQLIARWLY
jgi:pimeloyl-ACP methyl ester carboxylesterase